MKKYLFCLIALLAFITVSGCSDSSGVKDGGGDIVEDARVEDDGGVEDQGAADVQPDPGAPLPDDAAPADEVAEAEGGAEAEVETPAEEVSDSGDGDILFEYRAKNSIICYDFRKSSACAGAAKKWLSAHLKDAKTYEGKNFTVKYTTDRLDPYFNALDRGINHFQKLEVKLIPVSEEVCADISNAECIVLPKSKVQNSLR